MLIFKVGTLAKELLVHRNTVTNWIRNGKLKALPAPAKRYSVTKNEFIRFCKKEHISADAMERVLNKGAEPARGRNKSGEDILIPGADEIIGAVMVVGGGISGIQAAMDLADSGYYVYIVEKTAGIGGTMAQLDKTFPTNDCASCIILPKLVECGRHPNIEILTLARVENVQGRAGRFSIRVKKEPRYIDTDKCIACGICAEKCPIKVRDPFNFNISKKKAVYIRYGQSVPLKYAIEPEACIYFTQGKCRACEKFCPTGAVNFSQTGETVTLNVGAVILAPGFKPFDPSKYDFFGYPMIRDVVTSLEYERILSVSGPTGGALLRPSDHTEPRRIAWLQCVGSRNHNNCGNSYCSSVCCMSAVKQSMTSHEHIKGRDLERTIFFIDLRNLGAGIGRYRCQDEIYERTGPHAG